MQATIFFSFVGLGARGAVPLSRCLLPGCPTHIRAPDSTFVPDSGTSLRRGFVSQLRHGSVLNSAAGPFPNSGSVTQLRHGSVPQLRPRHPTRAAGSRSLAPFLNRPRRLPSCRKVVLRKELFSNPIRVEWGVKAWRGPGVTRPRAGQPSALARAASHCPAEFIARYFSSLLHLTSWPVKSQE